MQNSYKDLHIILIIFLIFISFGAGVALNPLLNLAKRPSITPPISKEIATTPDKATERENIKEGTTTYIDTLVLVTKDPNDLAFLITLDRDMGENKQHTNISYFLDGNWKRETTTETIEDPNIKLNEHIIEWQIFWNESTPQKSEVSGQVNIEGNTLSFNLENLSNEISVRVRPEYTRIFSEIDTVIDFNGSKYEAYAVYSRFYSSNSSFISFYSEDLIFNTMWNVLWDEDGNFYHLDITKSENDPDYKSHAFGFAKNNADWVIPMTGVSGSTTFKNDSSFNQEMSFTLNNNPYNLKLDAVKSLNKYPWLDHIWNIGIAKGTLESNGKSVKVKGITEYIDSTITH